MLFVVLVDITKLSYEVITITVLQNSVYNVQRLD